MIKRSFLNPIIFLVCSITLLLASCYRDKNIPILNVKTPEADPEVDISELYSAVIIPTFFELAQYSDIVILGHVQSEVGVINTSRGPGDRSKPNPRFFSVVPVYRIDVEKYLQGGGPDVIFVAHGEGRIYHGKTPSPDEIEQARLTSKNKTYIPLNSAISYLMFLQSLDIWNDYKIPELKPGNLFSRVGNPWLFDAADKKQVFVLYAMGNLERYFPPQPLLEIIAQMNDPNLFPPTAPYPAPVESPKAYPAPSTLPYP